MSREAYRFFDNDETMAAIPLRFELPDHLGGFDKNMRNWYFDKLNAYAEKHGKHYQVLQSYIVDQRIRDTYPNLTLCFYYELQGSRGYESIMNYRKHPDKSFKHFLCSFNGSGHIGRLLLVSLLHKFGWFNLDTCSKNFTFTLDELDGHIHDLTGDQDRFYRKFFISDDTDKFGQTIHSFGRDRLSLHTNIYKLEDKIATSFVNIVGETVSTGYYPFFTDKAFHSIVSKGLFVTYGQPHWYEHFEKYFGFRMYSKIFDYTFDTIQNPIVRLLTLITMLAKFSRLSIFDWHDLYLMEKDTIDYNYDLYFSQKPFDNMRRIHNEQSYLSHGL